MLLRPATKADSADLLRWRNDPVTRENSRNTGEVTQAEHDTWIELSLDNPIRSIFIAQNGSEAVGTIRVDKVDNYCVISLTVAPEHRGKGYGTEMVQNIVATYPTDILLADIKPENRASHRIFTKAGFVFDEHHKGLDWLVRVP